VEIVFFLPRLLFFSLQGIGLWANINVGNPFRCGFQPEKNRHLKKPPPKNTLYNYRIKSTYIPLTK